MTGFLIAIHNENTEVTTLHVPIDITTYGDSKPVFTVGGKVATVPFAGTVKEPDPDYMEMSIENACAIKFQRGVAEHGTVFKHDPLVELFAEMLDSINYCKKLIETDPNTYIQWRASVSLKEFECQARLIQMAYHHAKNGGRIWTPR